MKNEKIETEHVLNRKLAVKKMSMKKTIILSTSYAVNIEFKYEIVHPNT